MKVGIIGAGLIGNKRAEAVDRLDTWSLKWIADIDKKRAEDCAKRFGGQFTSDWETVIYDPEIDVVIISTYHDVAVPMVLAALENKKHVLCEKPLGRNSKESASMVAAAQKSGMLLKVGFNYRHYPIIKKAKQLIGEGIVGEVRYIRSILGHAARPDYDKEWRTHQDSGGGGALLDPGIHLIDLLRYFLGDFSHCSFLMQNAFWKIPFEDNAFLLFESKVGQMAYMQSSITEWKNLFSMEIIGTDGYIKCSGRGGFYGRPRIVWNKKWAWLKNGNTTEQEEVYSDQDDSFFEELLEFQNAIEEKREPMGNGEDGLYAAKIIDMVYQAQPREKVSFL